jgi:hypothetical protein
MPRKASEVGAFKDLEGHMFAIGSGNKNKNGDIDMLCTTRKKMATYIGIKSGNEAAQEWPSGIMTVPTESAYSYLHIILDRHATRVKVTRNHIELKLKSLRVETVAIEAKIINAPH